MYLANQAFIKPLNHLMNAQTRRALIAHLRHNFHFSRCFGEHTRLKNIVCQRFLHINVLAELHRRHRNHGVRVVGCRDRYRVNVLVFLQHFAEIVVLFRVRKLGNRAFRARPINVGNGNDIVFAIVPSIEDVGTAFSAATDAGNVEFVTRRSKTASQNVARDNEKATRRQS